MNHGEFQEIFENNVLPVSMITERLPFQIKIATQEQIIQVARMRSETYGRHLPELGSALA